MADLLVIVPTRGRPDNVRRLARAWIGTGACNDAALELVIDGDDPEHAVYVDLCAELRDLHPELELLDLTITQWQPMVAKLNAAAGAAADFAFALGFMGDDHVPRTHGWARAYLDALHELGSGIVYGNDLIQGERLPTQWAMTADIVRTLGRMVPAPVGHLYCDNAILALGRAAGCIRYLPEVVVEHMHPFAGRAQWDDGYRRVNAPDQYRRDGDAYRRWVAEQLDQDAAAVRALREGVTVGG